MTQPTITPDVLCQVSPPPSQGPTWGVSYTCNDPGDIIFWFGSILVGEVTITPGSRTTVPGLAVSGVNVSESHTSQDSCINSTLTFTGSNLAALNGGTLTCRNAAVNDSITIMLPSKTLEVTYILSIQHFCII